MIEVRTDSGRWDGFVERIKGFLAKDILELTIDGEPVKGYRSPDCPAIWIRDHSDIIRGGKYFFRDLKSTVDAFAATQAANGRVFDFVTHIPLGAKGEQENWEKWVRIPVEADVEYRFVKAAWLTWQATGDDEWIDLLLPNLEMALKYTISSPIRWDAEHELVKRAYTIDTWDFDYTAGRKPWLNFQLSDDTFWGISHADNSGLYEAAGLFADLCEHLSYESKIDKWREFAAGLRQRANKELFNGRFYRHFLKLREVQIAGVDEDQQLSLSNPMAINRGLAGHDEAVAILDEYRRRRSEGTSFAEWFSIDPPFPDGIFGDKKIVAGAYCNGGVMPLVGGELARAAFDHGREQYGVDTLKQYKWMIDAKGETFLWYFPDGSASTIDNSTSPDAMPTDGWGSSAMLYAFVEGLCGVQDKAANYAKVKCSPRWCADNELEAWVRIEYAASGSGFAYHWRHLVERKTIKTEFQASRCEVQFHLLLPDGTMPKSATWNGNDVDFEHELIEASSYVNLQGVVGRNAEVIVEYASV